MPTVKKKKKSRGKQDGQGGRSERVRCRSSGNFFQSVRRGDGIGCTEKKARALSRSVRCARGRLQNEWQELNHQHQKQQQPGAPATSNLETPGTQQSAPARRKTPPGAQFSIAGAHACMYHILLKSLLRFRSVPNFCDHERVRNGCFGTNRERM